MPYKIEIYEEEIIWIRFYGKSDFEESIRAREDMLNLHNSTGISKILADWQNAEVTPNVSTLDLYEFGSTWPKSKSSSPFRIAIVQTNDTESQERITFSEIVAKNRGLISRVFNELSEAQKWLKC